MQFPLSRTWQVLIGLLGLVKVLSYTVILRRATGQLQFHFQTLVKMIVTNWRLAESREILFSNIVLGNLDIIN